MAHCILLLLLSPTKTIFESKSKLAKWTLSACTLTCLSASC